MLPFGFGTTELIIVLALAMLIFGPKKLPDIGRTFGRGFREFKSTIGEVEDIKKSTIGQVDELKDTFKVDLDLEGKPKTAEAKEKTGKA